jgi:integrase
MARKRRGRGEGSIYQRGDGTWCGSVSAGYNANGKRRRHTAYGKTKQEVQEKLRELQQNRIPEVPRLTVKAFLTEWLETTVKPSRAASTYVRYEQVCRLHVVPHIGTVKLARLQPLHIQHLYRIQERAGASIRQRELSGVVLQKALKDAVRLRLIPYNPCSDVQKPRPQRREMSVWNRDQADAFLRAASSDRLYALYVLALGTGMREGELFALEWKDVDFPGAAVTVRRTLEEVGGRVRTKEPKTAKSRRRVDLPRFALNALHEHRKCMLSEGNAAAPVFCDQRGGYLRKSNVARRSFRPLMECSGIPRIRFHDLRHTAATLLLSAGENAKVVSERMGHASVQITLDTYAHVLPTMQKGAAEKLDQLFG